MGRAWRTSLFRLRSRTNDCRPPSIDSLVDERDPDLLGEVGGLAEALADQIERVLDGLEHLRIRQEARPGPATVALRSHLLDRALWLATLVFLPPDEPVPRRFHAHPGGQRVHDADPHAVKTARYLVAATAELAAGVEDGMDDLEGVLPRRMLADRHASTVILDDDHAVLADRDLDRRRLAGHRFVDRIVDHLPDEVVQPTGVSRADVH